MPFRSSPRPTRPTLRAALTALLAGALALAMLPGLTSSAQAAPGDDSPFSRIRGFEPGGEKVRVRPEAYSAHRVDLSALRASLPAGAGSAVVSIPAPDGTEQRFRVERTQVMESELAAAHPELATYAGVGLDDETTTIALDLTPMGFHASVRGANGQRSWYVDPANSVRGTSVHLSYYGAALPKSEQRRVEGEVQSIRSTVEAKQQADRTTPGAPIERRYFRLALTSDPSYADYFGAENVLAEKVTLINRVNQIYNDDLAVQLRLVNGTDLLNLDTDAEATGANGPCGAAPCFAPPTADADGELEYCDVPGLGKNRTVLGQLIGASNYDVGHLALGVNGGGIAYLGVVGGDYKGGGCTGLPEPTGDFFAIDYVAHEIGHQFGGDHTFNGALGACRGNIGEPAVEPGSGSSVMAYAGICRQDDLQPHTDPYFSFKTVDQVQEVMTSEPYGNVEVQTVSLRDFSAGDSFTLAYEGATSDPITFADYDAATLEAVIGELTGQTVSVAQWGFDEFGYTPDVTEPDVTGFQVIFNDDPSILAATADFPEMTFAAGAGVDGFVGETARGGPAQNGGILVESENANPVVTAPADKTIPLRTPFALTGSSTDPNGDSVVYLWEQTDFGNGVRLAENNRVTGPLFRVFGKAAEVTDEGTLESPSPGLNIADGSPTRVFPDLDQILANNTNAAAPCPTPSTPTTVMMSLPLRECYSELLPMAGYTGSLDNVDEDNNPLPPAMVFRLTARDRFVNGGGLAFDDVRLTIDPSTGPFLVTSQAAGGTVAGGSALPVTWAVNGTQALAPNVRISMSTDGGQSFGTVLAASTPNDGSQSITVPNVDVAAARIKIEAVDNYFFDLSDSAFAVTRTAPPVPGDTTAPDTTITSGPREGTFRPDEDVTFTFASTEAGSSFVCTLNGAALPCNATGAAITAPAGTHTFTVAARDAAGNLDVTPASRTWARPFDDRVLKTRDGFTKKKSARAYEGTYLQAREKGAKASMRVTDAEKIALVVGTGKGFGKVEVWLGKEMLKTVRLKGKKTRFGVIRKVVKFAGPTSGKVTIRTVNKRTVRIDGLGVLEG